MRTNGCLLRMVKQECFSHGVSVITLHAYRDFALQVEKTRQRQGGNELALVVAALVERYAKLGVDRKVLEDIRYNVFSIPPPAAETPNPRL